MRFSPMSFLIGLGAAYLLPVMSRSFRPLAVEATAFGMGLFDDLRRRIAEQRESYEDIVAEARARREERDADASFAAPTDTDDLDDSANNGSEPAPVAARRRSASTRRARVS